MEGYEGDLEKCVRFLESFESDYADMEGDEHLKYMPQLQEIANRTRRVLSIDLNDLIQRGEDDLVDKIMNNTRRYLSIFAQAADRLLDKIKPTVRPDQEDIYDVLHDMRTAAMERAQQQAAAAGLDNADVQSRPETSKLPTSLTRRFEVRLIAPAKMKAHSVRTIRSKDIGKLVLVKGIVTRVSDVKPKCVVATYTCDQCGCEIYQEISSRTFMPIVNCPAAPCVQNNTKGRLFLQSRGSRFVKFQEAKIQELADQVPIGHIPRSMTVHLSGELTRTCTPGDVVNITGIFLPTPYSGFMAIKCGLLTDTFLEAVQIEQLKKRYSEFVMTEEIHDKIEQLRNDGDAYVKLSKSIAPEIFGLEDVKKALLLQLVSAPTKVLPDGMKIRGDLHLCLMGDPGMAKSQLLKHISRIAPRAVYTTGKGSTGVGLTAAILRDEVTKDLVLEGGALVLADNGICCIDEFDKMDENDRTSIHEVMEQQTVSIAKGGITTTLNARTAVLAAANPVYGRYNRRMSPEDNINLPAALFSRFDLMFLILDEPDPDNDMALARHVAYVHRNLEPPPAAFDAFSADFMRGYISAARRVTPVMTADLVQMVSEIYVEMRKAYRTSRNQTFTSPRTLLSMLRLALALARLRFSPTVSRHDVEEAVRLMRACRSSIENVDLPDQRSRDPNDDIFHIIRDHAEKLNTETVLYKEILALALQRNFTEEQVKACLKEYTQLNIFSLSSDGARIKFAN